MNLEKKRSLATRTLDVGKGRIVFNLARLDEVKEAITKQDIRDLVKNGAIIVKEIGGRKTKVVRKTRRKAGSIKVKKNTRKRDYVLLTRRLRKHLQGVKKTLNNEQYRILRKEIKAKSFKNRTYLKDRISQIKGETK